MVKIFTESDPEELENELNKWINGAEDVDKHGNYPNVPYCMRRSIERVHSHNEKLIVFFVFIPI